MTDMTPIDPETAAPAAERVVLHVGCGAANPAKLPQAYFPAGQWRELRLDIDPSVDPDIVASITDMSAVADNSVDAVWSSHNLEHLFAHEVPLALTEFRRVLRTGGFALVTMPDLGQVARAVIELGLETPAYMSALGPVSALDMLYGFRPSIAGGNHFMAHRTGFTASSLSAALTQAGFVNAAVESDGRYNLWGIGHRI
jgi:SAM-dependent methyltransferase